MSDVSDVSDRGVNAPHSAANKNLERLNDKLGRWGRLQTRVLYALMDGRAKTREIARYCYDGEANANQIHNQRRAARSIGAVKVRRQGREWVWGLSR